MTALVRVFDDIGLNLELDQPTIFVLLDISNANGMDCSFLNCVNVMVFILRSLRLFHLIFFLGIIVSVLMTIFLQLLH
jgi:hypothetical protein